MTINDIAKLAKVSPSTVSRVLNNNGLVKEETKQRILKIVEESKFVPNAFARSLSNESLINNVGLIVPNIDNPFFAALAEGVSAAADECGYNSFLFNTNEDVKKELRFLQTSQEQRLRGLLMVPVVENDTVNRSYLLRLPIPVVMIDREAYNTNFDGVFSDDIEGAYGAVEALIKNGHTKIAQIMGPQTTKPGRARLEGYRQALEAHGIPYREEYVVEGMFQKEESYEGMQKLMKLKDPPTAIFSANNLTSIGVLKYLKEHNLRLGRDISMVGYDDIEVLEYTDMNLSTVSRPVQRMGYDAMMLLHERITHTDHRNGARKRIYLGAQLILRGSERMSARMAGRKEAEKVKAPFPESPEDEKGEMTEDVSGII
ncbi:MAG: LacI family transcriptional regulator [Lachnospiraceae bacterium]|jgi:LacI family transcriptional regulator|nr:LacI family transcriptional regulator [Lachnospiraceae bacterium]